MNGKTHRAAGELSGLALALIRNRNEDDWLRIIVRAAMGALGGNLGARGPDWLEPATGGRYHRDLLHSASAAGAMVSVADSFLSWLEREGKNRAEQAREELETADSFLERVFWAAASVFWDALVGLVQGLIAGYLSHLALDATTDMSIPLLVANERYLFRP